MADFQEIDDIVPLSQHPGTAAGPGAQDAVEPPFDLPGLGPARPDNAPLAPSPYAPPQFGANPASSTQLAAQSPYTPPQPGSGPSGASRPARNGAGASGPQAGRAKGLAGALAAIGAVLAKWWALALSLLLKLKSLMFAAKLLTAGKLLLTGGTMLLSMFLWSYRFGWPMAIGFVMSIFIHECGHALAAKRLGHKLGIMVFLPFMGAFVTARGGKNVSEGAFVGIMGPIAGTLTAVACAGIYLATQSPFWLVLAMLGFFLNLINLTPARPLDGGWIAPLFSPKLLLPGIVLGLIVFHSNPVVWVMAIMSVPSTIYAWKHGHESPYYQAPNRDRWIYGLTYLGLVAFLGTSFVTTSAYLRSHYDRQIPGLHRRSVIRT